MNAIWTIGAAMVAVAAMAVDQGTSEKEAPAVLDFRMNSLAGEEVDLARYHGKVVVMVNVASKCGMTPQYEALQALHEKYHEQGLAILGFPANNFGNQEPGTNEEIAEFCRENYGVSFDMFEKISVKGDDIHPLYQHLTDPETNAELGGEIRWNFTKFIISREGEVIARFEPRQRPDSEEFVALIEQELAK